MEILDITDNLLIVNGLLVLLFLHPGFYENTWYD